jgi:hypothetical protein
MVPATQPRFAIVFLTLLALGVSVGLPAEDILEAVYDESEAVSYERTPVFSVVVRPLPARTTKPPMSFFRPKLRAPSPFAPAHVRNIDVHQSTDARALSAQTLHSALLAVQILASSKSRFHRSQATP